MKNITKKNLTKIKKFASSNENDLVVTFVLDSLTKFFTANGKATFAS